MSYAWAKDRGWWLGREADKKPTHLLLDGGKLCVPDGDAGAFLNAYALSVVKGAQPAVVELRTRVFRLFMDLDVKTGEECTRPLDFEAVVRHIQDVAATFFETEEVPRVVVCCTGAVTRQGVTKAGRHLVWTNVFVTSAVALAFRLAVIEVLQAEHGGACTKPWDSVVDKCVFTTNGLRMAWSTKGRDSTGVYIPSTVWSGLECVAIDTVQGVSGVREWVRELSIRAVECEGETGVRDGVCIPTEADTSGGGSSMVMGKTRRLSEYAEVLHGVVECLPREFQGARITGIMQTETCFLLRSSSQYCLNRGACHNSCGTFYVVTLRGIRQKCFCQCETTEGRQYGLCKDFASDYYSVPDSILRAFFGSDTVLPNDFKAVALPSVAASRASSMLSDLLSRSRPPLKAIAKQRKRKM